MSGNLFAPIIFWVNTMRTIFNGNAREYQKKREENDETKKKLAHIHQSIRNMYTNKGNVEKKSKFA